MADFPYVPANPPTISAEPRRARGRLLTLTIVLAGALAMVLRSAPAAGAAGPARPTVRGYVDAVVATPGQIQVSGWSYDLNRPGVSNTENIVVDGTMAALPFANQARPDVNRAMRITGKHGYLLAVAARPGVRRLCVIARAVAGSGSSPVVLGCRTVTVPRS